MKDGWKTYRRGIENKKKTGKMQTNDRQRTDR